MQLTLERSLEAVASDALWGAPTEQDLQNAWEDHWRHFADESLERERLLKLFADRLDALRSADQMVKYLRAG